MEMVDVQLAKNPITSSRKCKFYRIIFQPLTSLQRLPTAIGQQTKIRKRSYEVLHNIDVAYLSQETPPHFLGNSIAYTAYPLALGLQIYIFSTWNDLSPPLLPPRHLVNGLHLSGWSYDHCLRQGFLEILDQVHPLSFLPLILPCTTP